MQSQVRFNRVPERVPEKVCFGAEACQVQQDSGEGTGEGLGGATLGSKGFRRFRRLGGFGAEPGQLQQGSGEGFGAVPEKVWEALVQPQIRLNTVPEKVLEGLGGFGAEPGQAQQGSGDSGEGF